MMLTFKALGWLITYPNPALIGTLPEIIAALEEERLLPSAHLADLRRFADDLSAEDLIEAQERYVELFDRGRQVSLHLFEHVHGESRDRGQAMVDLKSHYEAVGLFADSRELPDFLPMFLEYLSHLPIAQAREELLATGWVLQRIHAGLVARESRYAAPLAAILALAGIPAAAPAPAEIEDIDAEWAEAPVEFGPGAQPGTCPASADLVARLQAGMKETTPRPGRKS